MKRSMLALLLMLGAATIAAQTPLAAQRAPGSSAGSGGGAGPGPGAGPEDWGRHFFAPEFVMQHQSEIGFQDAQREALKSAIQQAQGKMMDVQWKLSGEGEKMGRLIQGTQVDEAQVLEQADRMLGLEREIKKAQLSLLVRIKNTLTAQTLTDLGAGSTFHNTRVRLESSPR